MGSLFKPTKQTSTQSSEPWKAQQPFLTDAFGQAQNLYNSKQGTPFYQGDLYANMDPLTSQGIGANASYATGAGADAAGGVLSSGQGLLGAGSQGLGAYKKLFDAASTDPTQSNIASAGAYANNPFMSGMIDAASRDVTRNLYENQIPGLNEAATGSGNMNSSRAGVAEGIMKRGAADQIGDISANLRGQAYENGLGLAEGARTSNMNGMATAAGGFGSVFGQGLGATQQGQNMTYQNNDALIQGGQLNQQDAQGQDNANFAQWQGQDTRDQQLLQQYYNIVGGQNWGGTGTTTQPGASPFQTVAGLAATAAGAYFSERRVKTNIVKVGERSDGLNEYEFDYRQDLGLNVPTGRQRGVMVDEVEQLRPDALGPVIQGVRTVDYRKLGNA